MHEYRSRSGSLLISLCRNSMDLRLCKRCASEIVEAKEKPTMDLHLHLLLLGTEGKVHFHRYGLRTKRGEELN
ncbi:hypothetical protein CEXT_720311 [Caerostris extrusa]|uniref:Transposase n=1 Tax=Caerostris extrusa TaxID=172846 RepID=A0AAV4SHY0_CAEEX|nr:hypothetical protein CEXT_720311 [Caerostris extrusa]